MKSAAEFFRAANGARVRKTVEGVLTVEGWPAWLEGVVENLKAQGASEGKDYKIDDSGLTVGNRFVLKPKLRALELGTLKVRSADYGFQPDGSDNLVWGDKKGATVEGGELIKRYPNGMIVRFSLAA